MALDDEMMDGVVAGHYVYLERAWAIPNQWYGRLVAFRTRGDKFGAITKSNDVWRCNLGYRERGMYGCDWWEVSRDMIVADLDEADAHIESFFSNQEAEPGVGADSR